MTATSTPRQGLATPPEVAEYLGRTVQALAALRTRGRGPAYVKTGRAVRYDWADVEQYVTASKRTSTRDEAPQ